MTKRSDSRFFMGPETPAKTAVRMFINPKNSDEGIIELDSEIGYWGKSSKQFRDELKALGKVSKINMRVNCPGGEILEGIDMYNALKEHPAEKTGVVTGLCASMATVLMMAMDKACMYSNTLFMIHNPQVMTGGDAERLRQDADLLDKMKTTAIDAYKTHAKSLARKDISDLMDDETWMTADEAKDWGFIDEVIEPGEMCTPLNFGTLKAPASVMQMLAKKFPPKAQMVAPPAQPQKTINEPLQRSEKMKVCLKCKKDIGDTDQCCKHCGADQDIAKAHAKEVDEATMKAATTERERIVNISAMCAEHKMTAEFQAKLVADGTDAKSAGSLILAEIAKNLKDPVAPGGDVHVGAEDGEKHHLSMLAGVMTQLGYGEKKINPKDSASPTYENVLAKSTVKTMGFHALMRDSALRSGMKASDVMNLEGESLYHLYMTQIQPKMASVSGGDVPNVIQDAQNKIMSIAFQTAETSFQDWCYQTDVKDFKQIKFPMLSFMERLKKLPAGSPMKTGRFTDKKEVGALDTYALSSTIDRQTLINDELGIIDQIASAYGQSARYDVNEAVYDYLFGTSQAGPTMNEDGLAMFYATTQHANIITSSGVPSNTTLAKAEASLRAQTGPVPNVGEKGRILNRRGKFIISGTNNMYGIFNLVSSPSDPTGTINSAVPNFARGQGYVQVIDAYLQSKNTAGSQAGSWYLACDLPFSPIVVNYLNGLRNPTIRSAPSEIGEALGIHWDIFWDWCIAARDWRGIILNQTT